MSIYYSLVRNTVIEKWQNLEPLDISPEDFNAGIEILNQVAQNNISKLSSEDIVEYVTTHEHQFRKICTCNFPFSKFDSKKVVAALETSFGDVTSLLTHFLMEQGEWQQKDLNSLDQLTPDAIASTCRDLLTE